MTSRQPCLIPMLGATAVSAALLAAPTAAADCNSVGNSTLCSSGGSVTGSSGAPTYVPTYDPYPCVGDPLCSYYDYDPGIIFNPPDWGGGGIGGGIGGGGRPGGGGGIGPR